MQERSSREEAGGRGGTGEATGRLGESLEGYLKERGRQLEKNSVVVEEWERLLPENLRAHCRLISLEWGVLEAEADAGVYMHELKAMTNELVEELKRRCPRAGVKQIRLRAR